MRVPRNPASRPRSPPPASPLLMRHSGSAPIVAGVPSPVPVRPRETMSPLVIPTVVTLLAISNVFMTFAWYGHLKDLAERPWYVAVLVSWLIAFFEYLVQVPANRFGDAHRLSLGQLKILQEV